MNTEWMNQAACAGRNVEWWYPFSGMSTEAARAVNICGTCPVRLECYGYAVTNGETYGIWGGVMFGGRSNVTRGSYEEEELRDAVYKSLDAGWSLGKTARHLRMPFNMARRFARERHREEEVSIQETETTEVIVDPSTPTEQLLHRMKKLLKGET